MGYLVDIQLDTEVGKGTLILVPVSNSRVGLR